MTLRASTTSLIPGRLVAGNRGLGVRGSAVPATGTNGPGFLYNDLALPAEANKEVRGLILTRPSAGSFFAYENSAFTLIGAPNGTYTFSYRLFVDGADLGTATVTIIIGGTSALADVSLSDMSPVNSATRRSDPPS